MKRHVDGRIGLHYYRWHDCRFTLLQVDKHVGLNRNLSVISKLA